MKKFEDLFESEVEIAESENDQVLATIKFPWGRADKENKNKRFYPFEIFKNAVEKLAEKIKWAFVPGQTDHPLMGGSTRLGDVSHILKNVWLKDKVAWAEADLLKTSKGKDILRVIKSGCPMGASLRGIGEVGSDGKIKKGLEILTVDLVSNPSFGADAEVGVHNIVHESTILEPGIGKLSFEEKRLAGVHSGLIESKIEKRSKEDTQCYQEYLLSGGKKTFLEWQEEK